MGGKRGEGGLGEGGSRHGYGHEAEVSGSHKGTWGLWVKRVRRERGEEEGEG